jgi:hypothetical protein
MVDVVQIRRRYPNPREPRFDDSTPASYCVGAAFIQYMGASSDYRFPTPEEIVPYLLRANRALDVAEADVYAKEIVYYNDAARFDRAWETLRGALQHSPAQAA